MILSHKFLIKLVLLDSVLVRLLPQIQLSTFIVYFLSNTLSNSPPEYNNVCFLPSLMRDKMHFPPVGCDIKTNRLSL